ncbi:MAG: pantoate--beta-alanine ligase [Bacteroidetes bacterium]|nr:pantoate--beta-alanine ligase [Bacteroidota bacterium]
MSKNHDLRLFKKIVDLQAYLKNNASIGFVPTMGALHEGHLSLIERSKAENTLTVCSIFVNPKQFNNADDFTKYPITIDKDIRLLEQIGCDVLFLPDVKEIYPPQDSPTEKLDFGFIGTTLEGAMRPGHFDGVAIVVERLIRIVHPNKMYLGLKDYQQVLIIKKMVELKALALEIITCPTHRESDGLAMSSRNARLNSQTREEALILSKVLFWMRDHIHEMSMEILIEQAKQKIIQFPNIKLEYLEIRNAENLHMIEPGQDMKLDCVILIAAWAGDVRLYRQCASIALIESNSVNENHLNHIVHLS